MPVKERHKYAKFHSNPMNNITDVGKTNLLTGSRQTDRKHRQKQYTSSSCIEMGHHLPLHF